MTSARTRDGEVVDLAGESLDATVRRLAMVASVLCAVTLAAARSCSEGELLQGAEVVPGAALSHRRDRLEPRGRAPLVCPRDDDPEVREVLSRFGHAAGHVG